MTDTTGTNPSDLTTPGMDPEATIDAFISRGHTAFDALRANPLRVDLGYKGPLGASDAIPGDRGITEPTDEHRAAIQTSFDKAVNELLVTGQISHPDELDEVPAAESKASPTAADTAATTKPKRPLDELADEVSAYWVIAMRAKELKEEREAELRWRLLERFDTEKLDRIGSYLDEKQTVSWAVNKPAPGPRITKPDAFTSFIGVNFPDQVQMVFEVYPAFQKALLKRLERVPGTDAVVDPATGLIVDGVEWMAPKPSSISPSWKPEGKDRILENISVEDIANMFATVFQHGWEEEA
ncbi:hypothetical protein [Actinacidiphila sp. bgisy160]|uniref:hypothetical protein n=1 Tax=Actinacidiphila sp. bgisy160 TaxID=3413796 RepID=UPI003D728D35